MSGLMQRLYTADQARKLDRVAMDEFGMDGYELMKRAGLAGYRWLRYCFPRARKVEVYCGSGNNGGDGYTLATLARQAGMEVTLTVVSEAKTDTARQALDDYRRSGGEAAQYGEAVGAEADVLVDALLGTGLASAPTGVYARAIDGLNQAAQPVLSLDIPSGLHADTGCMAEPCVRADATATFIGRKIGCFTAGGRAAAGNLYFDDLDVPGGAYDRVAYTGELIQPQRYRAFIGNRPATSHKGDAGRVLIVGGNHGMPGAPCLSSRAAHRAGAGLVHLATRSRPVDLVSSTLESMAVEIGSAADIEPMLDCVDVVAIGPGLGRDEWAAGIWQSLRTADGPLVIDADGLNLLAREPRRRDDWILTPHPGEAGRLLNISSAQVQADRITAARQLRDRYGGVVVLKGPGTLVLGEELHVCEPGNPGMASGGMGDVLTGIIAGFCAQGMSMEDAACYGVWCHGRAADLGSRHGTAGLTAGDVINELRSVVDGSVDGS